MIGYCDGTMTPSSSPNFSSLEKVADGCPKAYNAATIYDEGDAVSVFVSSTPDRVVVYTCKAWPNKAFYNAA
jgi:predicted nucleotidyltransferase